MMDLFLRLFNMSVTASWLIFAILFVRPFLEKAPKWIRGILWGLVGIRLILPMSFESAWSLVPSKELIVPNAVEGAAPTFASGIDVVDASVNTYLQQRVSVENIATARGAVPYENVLLGIWLLGMVLLMLYSTVSYVRLRRHVADAVKYCDNIYQTEKISSPFVLGFLKPAIYVPYCLEQEALVCVIAHERAHIRRKDHWIKPFAFLLVTIHWFNPIVWAAYYCLCQDIELACDEKVIHELGFDKKKMYSQTLLECSVERHFVRACPIAFGEIGVGKRVKNILEMKKTKVGIVIVALLACVVVAVCFLSDPKSEERDVATKENVAASADQDTSAEQEKAEQERAEQEKAEQEREALLQAQESAKEAEETVQEQQEEQEAQKAGEELQEENAAYTLGEEVSVEQFGFPFMWGVDYSITALFEAEEPADTEVNVAEEYMLLEGEDMHEGIDLAAEAGTEVLSCTNGTVKEVGFDVDYGNYVVIEGMGGFTCYYMHLEEYSVEQGDTVSMGDVIGTVGSTGKSTGPHLHFGIQNPDGEWIDPASIFEL